MGCAGRGLLFRSAGYVHNHGLGELSCGVPRRRRHRRCTSPRAVVGRDSRPGVLSPLPRSRPGAHPVRYLRWMEGIASPIGMQERLKRCFLESSLPAEEFVARWVPEFFTEAASHDLKEEMSKVVSEFHPKGFRLMAKSSAEMDTTDVLPNIEVPTLLVWGDDDRRSPMNIAEQFRDTIPDAKLAIIAYAGHVSNMEQPEAFDAQVRRFCLSNLST